MSARSKRDNKSSAMQVVTKVIKNHLSVKIESFKLLVNGKRIIIAALLEKYDMQTAYDIQEALKDLLGGTIQSTLESEMNEHLGYEPYERTDSSNARNGKNQSLSGVSMERWKLRFHRFGKALLILRLQRSARRIFQA